MPIPDELVQVARAAYEAADDRARLGFQTEPPDPLIVALQVVFAKLSECEAVRVALVEALHARHHPIELPCMKRRSIGCAVRNAAEPDADAVLAALAREFGGYVTKTGKVLTDVDIQALADEAERGYDVSQLKNRPSRRDSR